MSEAAAADAGQADAALSGLRVLDLSGSAGQYCGKMFADLGAEVILVEPPGGSQVRKAGPFFGEIPGLENSIPFFYFNANKRGITLDLDAEADRAIFRDLVRHADLIIETEKPGAMAARGIGYDDLRKLRPSLAYVAITPFGQTGPYIDYETDDLILLALGGLMSLGGYPAPYPKGSPMAIYGNQAFLAASQFAAVASMAVLTAAEQRGIGDYIDVSIQECVAMALENAVQFYDLEGLIRKRAEAVQGFTGQYEASDGYFFVMAGGVASSDAWHALVRWIDDIDPAVAARLREPRWNDSSFASTAEARAEFAQIISAATKTRTKAELYETAKAFRVPMGPVLAPLDILHNPQLAFRDFFLDVWSPQAGKTIKMPRAPYLFSKTPVSAVRPAPILGADDAELKRRFSR